MIGTIRCFGGIQIPVICLIGFLISNCVPNEKVVYLQGEEMPDEVWHSIYTLRPNDVISIKVSSLTPSQFDIFSQPTQQSQNFDPVLNGYELNATGEIKIPIIGSVSLLDLSVDEAEVVLERKLSSVYKQVSVTIKLLNFYFIVLGEVKNPGRFVSYTEKVSLLDALAFAGDVTDFGDKSQIQITRFEDNKPKMEYINTLNREFLTTEYFMIRPGDIINVIPLKEKNTRKYKIPNYALVLSTITVGLLIFNTVK